MREIFHLSTAQVYHKSLRLIPGGPFRNRVHQYNMRMTLRQTLTLFWRGLRWLWRAGVIAAGLLLMTILLQRSTYPTYLQFNAVADMVSDYQFDYISWEVDALLAKAGQTLRGNHAYVSESERSQFVRDYMADLGRARQLEGEVAAVYTDPDISDPDATSADLRAQRDALRDDLRRRQTTAEAILEGQVAAILVDEGFGTLGQLLPPISMHFTQVPNLLIVSPRDQIRFDISINIEPLTVDEIAALEDRIAQRHDVSALIVPLGGIALYPAMILETTSIAWAVETFAHEWLHHYLFFFPLGLSYFDTDSFAGETRVINETVADTFGKVIAPRVLARYYPELVAAAYPSSRRAYDLSHPRLHDAVETQRRRVALHLPVYGEGARGRGQQQIALIADDPPAFDFGAEMNETRVTVDRYLAITQILQRLGDTLSTGDTLPAFTGAAQGFDTLAAHLVVETERYMEARRALFFDNGWRIRKLNQAYFAFYGGYQAGDIPGIAGEDPIGPAIAEILQNSGDVHEFVVRLRGITSREALLALRDRLRRETT